MTDDRRMRGRRVLGRRRLRATIAVLIGVLACVCASIAAASTGGTGLGGKPATPHRTPVKAASGNPFAVRGMWIWYVSMSDGGKLSAIISRAHRYGIKTLMIKSGDGTGAWSQFTPKLVATLHANGLKVCGWQYVYGNAPATEAHVGAAAAKAGADCLLIDAEGEYEGRYVQAQRYITTLRKLVGTRFPLALAGFPYIDYHPAYPYSVFLGPGGAQYNTPQMYWVDIGTTVDAVYSHTYDFNRIYQRPIYPLGQVYNSPPNSDIVRFRQLSLAYGSGGGISWWDWQEAGSKWHSVGQPIATLANFSPDTSYARIGRGAQGDVVVWAEEHLVTAGQKVAVDGSYGPKVQSAVKRFQTAHGLSATGVIDTATWQQLLHYAPTVVHWTKHSARLAAAAGVGTVLPVPKSAGLRAKRNELAGTPGRGALPGQPR
jgi:hypothetical protein